MFETVLRKGKFEVSLLFLVSAVSLGVASSMIGDSTRALATRGFHNLALVFLRASGFIVGVLWLPLSVKLFREVVNLMRRHYRARVQNYQKLLNYDLSCAFSVT